MFHLKLHAAFDSIFVTMHMAIWISLSAITGIIVIAMLRLRSRRKQAAAAPRGTKKSYQSVTVKWRLDACEAVKQLDGKRFIGSEAPNFPVAECDVEQCACRYEFHSDRREGDRRILHGLRHSLIVINGSEDKRSRAERRRDG
ncbi:MAG: hypothetical protein ACR2P1_29530 [Pseudomonadales bacterium]